METQYATIAVTVCDGTYLLFNRLSGQKAAMELICKFGVPKIGQTIELKGFDFVVKEITHSSDFSTVYRDPERPDFYMNICVEGVSDDYRDYYPVFWYDLPAPVPVLK